MPEESSRDSQLEARAQKEADIIMGAFGDCGIEIDYFRDPADQDDDVHPGGIAFMYAKGHLLTREQYLGGVGGIKGVQSVQSASKQRGVLDIIQQPEFGVTGVEPVRLVEDILLLCLKPNRHEHTSKSSQTPGGKGENSTGEHKTPQEQPASETRQEQPASEAPQEQPASEAPEEQPPDVLAILDAIDKELGPGIATLDHVLTAAQAMAPCSATEPEPVYPTTGPYPAVCRDGGARVRVFVADTGLAFGAATTFPWLHDVQGDVDPRSPGGVILPYGGHGTFVAGVLRCLAPETRVYVANVFNIAGSALESELVLRLNAEFGFGFEILHLTASCMTRNNIALMALETWLELLRTYKGVVCIAPAGNNHTRRPSWPGAFRGVISVGALATDQHHRADFSDYGGWVDVYAPGEKLINAFGSGTYTYYIPDTEQVRMFSGLAQWSGTSFSAPIVTGLIAARMARCGESAREAADALLARARDRAIPGVGPVLLPSCGGEDDECHGDRGSCGDRGCGRGRCGCHCCGDHG